MPPLPDRLVPAASYAVRVDAAFDLATLPRALGLTGPRPAVVIVGGAGGMGDDAVERVRALCEDGIVPLVEACGGAVVDGGTDAGVMRAIGRARAARGAGFPLIGVAAEGTLAPLDTAPSNDQAHADANHSHFVLVPGSAWGDESPWIAKVAGAIAGSRPSATVLINGGTIAAIDIAHSLDAGRPVVVVSGTGRLADELANGPQQPGLYVAPLESDGAPVIACLLKLLGVAAT